MTKRLTEKQIALIVTAAVIATLLLVYVGISIFFGNHYWFRTTINGVSCTGKTVEEVEKIITREIGSYKLTLVERQERKEVLTGSDIELLPEFDGSLEILLNGRSGFAWPLSLFRTTHVELDTMVVYDEELLEQQLQALNCMDSTTATQPENAYLSEYIPGRGYEIIPEEEGTLVDAQALIREAGKAIVSLQEQMSLEETGCYVEPEIRTDDPDLIQEQEHRNILVQAVITHEFGSDKEILDGKRIHQWLVEDEKGTVIVDLEKVREYVKELAAIYNTAYKSRTFPTSYGNSVTLSRNEYGWRIDIEEETTQLLADIEAGSVLSREPIYSQKAREHSSQDYGNTYVEINLTAQHLFYYKDGSLMVESDFVSGNIAKGNGTPTGVFSVMYTQRDAILRGEDYRTPVNFWMPFNGGIGLHDATWRRDFGGNYYKTNGSHGCINLPYKAAKTIFNNLKSGDAVFVYELAGTESAKSKAQDEAAQVDSAIAAIGAVTLNSSAAINSARTIYDSLNEMGKGYVKKYDVLVAAETTYGQLVAQLQQEQQARSQAQTVIDAINAIGTVTLDRQDAIANARNLYNALSNQAKGYVSNLNVLTAAEDVLARLQQEG